MALDKAIESGKEHRKPYIGCKAVDTSCRNHGSCSWCAKNRQYQKIKDYKKALDKLKEWEYNDNIKGGNENDSKTENI